MSAYTKWISPKTIMQDVINRTAHEGSLNDELVAIAVNQTIDKILTGDTHKECIAIIDMYNYKASLPVNFRYPSQVAYRRLEEDSTDPYIIKKYFLSTLRSKLDDTVKVDSCNTCKQEICACETKQWYPVQIDCDYVHLKRTPEIGTGYSDFMYGVYNYDKAKLPSHFNDEYNSFLAAHDKTRKLIYDSKRIFSRSKKCPEFQLVRPTSNYFFNLPASLKACNVPSYDTNLEYQIEDGVITINNFRSYNCNNCSSCTSRKYNNHPSDYASLDVCEYNYKPEKNGQLLISYLGRRMDDEGFLMIPDEEYIADAVTFGAIEYLAFRQYSKTKTAKDEKYWMNVRQEAFLKITRAKSRFRVTTFDKWEQYVENHWNKRIPYRDYKDHNNTSMQDAYRLPNESYIDNTSDYRDNYYKGFY